MPKSRSTGSFLKLVGAGAIIATIISIHQAEESPVIPDSRDPSPHKSKQADAIRYARRVAAWPAALIAEQRSS
jgi:hypothetical protein